MVGQLSSSVEPLGRSSRGELERCHGAGPARLQTRTPTRLAPVGNRARSVRGRRDFAAAPGARWTSSNFGKEPLSPPGGRERLLSLFGPMKDVRKRCNLGSSFDNRVVGAKRAGRTALAGGRDGHGSAWAPGLGELHAGGT